MSNVKLCDNCREQIKTVSLSMDYYHVTRMVAKLTVTNGDYDFCSAACIGEFYSDRAESN